MSLVKEQLEDHARRIIKGELLDFEYSYVYEDEELADESEEVWEKVHDLITSAKVQVSWE